MKRKVILIDTAEFHNQPISFPSIIDFEGIDTVVFVVKSNGEHGGIDYLGAYCATQMTVGYTKVPMAQTLNIDEYGVVPLEDDMKAKLLHTNQYVDEVPEQHQSIYSAKTEILFAE